MKSFIGIAVVSLLLGACGGGGGGGSSSGGGNSSQSGGEVVSNSCGSDGVLFKDCVNKNWGSLKAWEYEIRTGQGQGYTTGTNPSNVQWKEVDSPAAGHGKVLEISYGAKTGHSSQVYINVDPVDRSAYATGKLKFDLNVQSFGDAYDAQHGQMLFEVIAECVWPCTSHSAKVPVNFLNQWQTVELNIADMVRDGLDLKRVDTGFLIRPSIEDGVQTGVSFQVDNIQWVKGTGSISAAKDVFAEHFNTQDSASNWKFVTYGGAIAQSEKFLSQGLVTFPYWMSSMDHWALEHDLGKAINIKNKEVSLQIKLVSSSAPDFRSPIEFALIATDGANRQASTERFSSQGMIDKQWQQVSTRLGSNFAGEFDAADVRKLAIHIYATDHPLPYGYINLDTIRIAE